MTDDGAGPQVTVRPATRDDADFVCRKLAESFSNATMSERRVHFAPPWPLAPDVQDYGVVAEYEGRIVGFAGAFASDRVVGGRLLRFRNLSSWWVDPAQRGKGVGKRILAQYFTLREEAVNTLLSTAPSERAFWDAQPVRSFERARRVYPFPALRPSAWTSRVRVLPAGVFPAELGEEASRILRDHHGLRCQVLVLERDGRYCGVITRRRNVQIPADQWSRATAAVGRVVEPGDTRTSVRLMRSRLADLLRGALPCAEIFYVSDRGFVREHLWPVLRVLASRQRAVAVVADAARLGVPEHWGCQVPSEYFVWQPCPVPDEQVDALYSEFFALPVGQESR